MKKIIFTCFSIACFSIFSSSVSLMPHHVCSDTNILMMYVFILKLTRLPVSLVDLQKGSSYSTCKIYISDNTKNIQSISAAWESRICHQN